MYRRKDQDAELRQLSPLLVIPRKSSCTDLREKVDDEHRATTSSKRVQMPCQNANESSMQASLSAGISLPPGPLRRSIIALRNPRS